MDTDNIDLFGIVSESRKIIKSHSRHFLALSLLFNLPLSFALLAFPTLLHAITNNDTNTIQSEIHLLGFNHLHIQQRFIGLKPFLFYFIYYFTCLTLFICATGTITYSLYQGFSGQPVKFVIAIKSLSNSFLQLFGVFLFVQFIILTRFFWCMFFYGISRGIKYLGFENYSSIYYNIALVMLGLDLLYLLLHWILAPVIVVVESSEGMEPLMQSFFWVRPRSNVEVYFTYLLCIGVGVVMCGSVWLFWGIIDGLKGFHLVLQIVMSSTFMTLFLLLGMTANTVMYMYYKALHTKLAQEAKEENEKEIARCYNYYEEKSPHVVYIAQP